MEDIRKKTEVLANMKRDLVQRNITLENEIARLKQVSEQDKVHIEEMKGRLKIVKMAKTLESVDEKSTDSKYKINQLDFVM